MHVHVPVVVCMFYTFACCGYVYVYVHVPVVGICMIVYTCVCCGYRVCVLYM